MTLNLASINVNMALGLLAIVGIGILVRFDILATEYATLALGTLLGAGATKVQGVIGGGKAEPPAEPVPPTQ